MPELATDAEAEIRRHGTETYPNECCGALIASGGTIVEAFPLPNTTAEGPRRRFLIGPNDNRLAEGHAQARGGTLETWLGWFRNSETDLAQAWPNLTYIIVAVRDGRPEDLRFWRLREDRSGFEEI